MQIGIGIGISKNATTSAIASDVSADGKNITFEVANLNSAGITAIQSGKTVTVTATSLHYTSTTADTATRSLLCSFVSASGSNPALVTVAPVEPIYQLDTLVKISADAGAFNDGSTASAAIVNAATTNASTLAYPIPNARIAGVVAGGNIGVNYSLVSSSFDVEVVALGHFADGNSVAAVKISVTDGVTTLTSTVTSMSRSTYDPSVFYDASLAAGLISTDPFAANSGGSGVYKATFNPASLLDGSITVTAETYPIFGGASQIRSESWTLRNDAGGTLTAVNYYVDSRGTMDVVSVVGTFVAGERINGGTSGAIGRYISTTTGSMLHSIMSGTLFANGETVTGVTSGATATVNSVPVYNGNNSNAGTSSGAPKRHLWVTLESAASTTQKFTVNLMGDAGYQTYYSVGRNASTSNTNATWAIVKPNTGLTKSNIYIMSAEGANFSDCRARRVCLQDVTCVGGFTGDDTRNTALWLDNVAVTSSGGPVGASSSWPFSEYSNAGGSYITAGNIYFVDSAGIDQQSLARNIAIADCNEDGVRSCGLAMEIFINNNDSPDVNSHEDMIQFVDTSNSNRVYYNIAGVDIATPQLFLSDDVFGASICNVLGVSATVGSGYSQYGDSASTHIVDSVVFSHLTFANSALSHRNFAGSTDRNAFVRYSVMPDFTGYDLSHASNYNVLTNSTDNQINVKAGLLTNPWVSGVGPATGDNPATRNYKPSGAYLEYVPSGKRYVAFDLFGYARRNDGTGCAGAIES